ncbi:1,4-dihydroxy-2-naphthoate polyprenyltransferase [Corynebacterium caspium]|uniref:1,4-dihydroxy-2-naphthoate polyprenyltransferase n=1 Tax=Corynebacterium caspium TaxID=234828 RepID=UPI000373DF05
MSAMPANPKRHATPAEWLEGARPHTWANAVAPVIVGTGAAAYTDNMLWWKALLALIVSGALIIGVNYANDYSDGIRGTDEDRTGPLRLTGSGLARPAAVKRAAFLSFAVAGVAGVVLAITSAWWLVLLGAFCIAGAWFYTGGKNPYGYRGLGEVAVFIFFGLIGVLGTEFVQAGRISLIGFGGAIAIGAISASVNLTNNLRDIPSDKAAGKITLAVRLGDSRTRKLMMALSLTPFLITILFSFATPLCLLALSALPLVYKAIKPVRTGAAGRDLIPVLGLVGRGMLVWAGLTAITLAFTG